MSIELEEQLTLLASANTSNQALIHEDHIRRIESILQNSLAQAERELAEARAQLDAANEDAARLAKYLEMHIMRSHDGYLPSAKQVLASHHERVK